jgi:hypothetical protein
MLKIINFEGVLIVPTTSPTEGITKITNLLKQNEYLERSEEDVTAYIMEKRKKKETGISGGETL